MANTILIKKSGTPSSTPTASELAYGELAINYADGKIFYKNSSNVVADISGSATGGTSAGGGNTQVQFNNTGVLGGDADLTFDGTMLSVGSLKVGNGFWINTNTVSSNQTIPTGETWKSLTNVSVDTGVNVIVNGTWTLQAAFGD